MLLEISETICFMFSLKPVSTAGKSILVKDKAGLARASGTGQGERECMRTKMSISDVFGAFSDFDGHFCPLATHFIEKNEILVFNGHG